MTSIIGGGTGQDSINNYEASPPAMQHFKIGDGTHSPDVFPIWAHAVTRQDSTQRASIIAMMTIIVTLWFLVCVAA